MNPTTVNGRSVRSLIAGAIERIENPDPRAIAELVVVDLDEEEVREYATQAIQKYVGHVTNPNQRRMREPSDSSKWTEVGERHQSGELVLDRLMIWTGAARKWLLDCTRADLAKAADDHLKQAAGYERTAEQFRQLGNLMRRHKAEVVGDLPTERVREVFDA